jgi:hypothetical protein
MKKRLLLIFVIGISFSPSVFASDGIGEFNKANNGGEIYCATLHQWVKKVDTDSSQSAPESGEVKAGSMTLGQNAPAPNGG